LRAGRTALWAFGPADFGVSIRRLDTPPGCTVKHFFPCTKNLGAVHTSFDDVVDLCPTVTVCPATSLSVDIYYEMLVSLKLG
jgi:hypothetical protein